MLGGEFQSVHLKGSAMALYAVEEYRFVERSLGAKQRRNDKLRSQQTTARIGRATWEKVVSTVHSRPGSRVEGFSPLRLGTNCASAGPTFEHRCTIAAPFCDTRRGLSTALGGWDGRRRSPPACSRQKQRLIFCLGDVSRRNLLVKRLLYGRLCPLNALVCIICVPVPRLMRGPSCLTIDETINRPTTILCRFPYQRLAYQARPSVQA